MLKIEHISKTFNAGTVNEKKALTDLSLYLASLEGSSAADESLCIYEGFAPSECDGSLRKAFD